MPLTLSTETAILSHLLTNENYTRKVLPFLKNEYFEKSENKIIFDEFYKFMDEYNALPSKEALHIEIEKRSDLNEETWKNTQDPSVPWHEDVDERWLVNVTDRYCKDRAIHLAVLEGIHIINGDDKIATLIVCLIFYPKLFLLVLMLCQPRLY